MKVWKSRKVHKKHGVWSSEIRLRELNTRRLGKVKRLLSLLKEEFDEAVPRGFRVS